MNNCIKNELLRLYINNYLQSKDFVKQFQSNVFQQFSQKESKAIIKEDNSLLVNASTTSFYSKTLDLKIKQNLKRFGLKMKRLEQYILRLNESWIKIYNKNSNQIINKIDQQHKQLQQQMVKIRDNLTKKINLLRIENDQNQKKKEKPAQKQQIKSLVSSRKESIGFNKEADSTIRTLMKKQFHIDTNVHNYNNIQKSYLKESIIKKKINTLVLKTKTKQIIPEQETEQKKQLESIEAISFQQTQQKIINTKQNKTNLQNVRQIKTIQQKENQKNKQVKQNYSLQCKSDLSIIKNQPIVTKTLFFQQVQQDKNKNCQSIESLTNETIIETQAQIKSKAFVNINKKYEDIQCMTDPIQNTLIQSVTKINIQTRNKEVNTEQYQNRSLYSQNERLKLSLNQKIEQIKKNKDQIQSLNKNFKKQIQQKNQQHLKDIQSIKINLQKQYKESLIINNNTITKINENKINELTEKNQHIFSQQKKNYQKLLKEKQFQNQFKLKQSQDKFNLQKKQDQKLYQSKISNLKKQFQINLQQNKHQIEQNKIKKYESLKIYRHQPISYFSQKLEIQMQLLIARQSLRNQFDEATLNQKQVLQLQYELAISVQKGKFEQQIQSEQRKWDKLTGIIKQICNKNIDNSYQQKAFHNEVVRQQRENNKQYNIEQYAAYLNRQYRDSLHFYFPAQVLSWEEIQFWRRETRAYMPRISCGVLLYKQDAKNLTNIHHYVDGRQNIMVIVHTPTCRLGAFSQHPLCPASGVGPSVIFNFTNKTHYPILPGQKPFIYNEYYLSFGSAEFRIKSNEPKIYSSFGLKGGVYDQKGSNLLGKGNEKQDIILMYWVYQFHLA